MTLLDLDARDRRDAARSDSKASNSPFIGETLHGRAVATIVGGAVRYDVRAAPTQKRSARSDDRLEAEARRHRRRLARRIATSGRTSCSSATPTTAQVETYSHPYDALPKIDDAIDLLIVDLEMPGMDGKKFVDYARAERRLRRAASS